MGAASGQFEDLLERAQIAYEDHLGAGSMIYLRKIFEAITTQVANIANIQVTTSKGRRKTVSRLAQRGRGDSATSFLRDFPAMATSCSAN